MKSAFLFFFCASVATAAAHAESSDTRTHTHTHTHTGVLRNCLLHPILSLSRRSLLFFERGTEKTHTAPSVLDFLRHNLFL